MTQRFKLAYIGAGSFRFSIGFFRNITNAVDLLPMEVALCDINEKSLTTMYKILKKMVIRGAKKKGYDPDDILVTKSTDRRDVLENADFVYKSISVGLQEAEWYDNYLPLKFGIPQNTGDTLGPGGLFRSLRTNHVAAAIAEDMNELCPNATLLNYTNPQGSIVMAARTKAPDVQYIGLCHEYFGGGATIWGTLLVNKLKFIIGKLTRPDTWWEKIDFEYGGINHFGWFTKIEYKGKDYYPWFRKKARKLTLKKRFGHGYNFHLLERYNWFPYPGSRHVAEFMTNYYNYFNYETQCPYWKFPVIRDVGSLDHRRNKKYEKFRAMANGEKKVPKPRKIGERAMEMTLDWRDSVPNHHVVNIPNTHPDYDKIIPELPDDCIVEIPGYFKDQKILPIHTIHLPDNIADLVRPHAEQQRLTVNASLGNDLDSVVKAMLHDPMANWIEDDDKLEYLTKLMLYYQQEWLPEEWQEWIPQKQDLEEHKWWVSKKDLAKDNDAYKKVMFPPDPSLEKKAFFWDDWS